MRDELLALLEDGPKAQSQLAAWLNRPLHALGEELRDLAGEGLVKQVGYRRLWALASHEPRPGGRPRTRPAVSRRKSKGEVTRIENVRLKTDPSARGRFKIARQDAAKAIDRLLGIVEPVSGTAVCAGAGCGKRFTPIRETETFCSDACRAAGVTSARRTLVVNGVEFVATSVGKHSLTAWPDHDGMVRGSSLSDIHSVMKV